MSAEGPLAKGVLRPAYPSRPRRPLLADICIAMAWCGVVCSAAVAETTVLHPARQTASASCPAARWSQPRVIHLGGAAVARWPSVSESDRTLVIAGTNIQRLADTLRDSSLIFWTSREGRLRNPRPSRPPIVPQVLIDRDGTNHLIWAESPRDSLVSVGQARDEQQKSVWSSERRRRAAWTRPHVILSARSVLWLDAALLRTRDGRTLFVVVSAQGVVNEPPGLFVLRWTDNTWTAHRIDGTRGAIHPSLAEDDRGRLHLGFIMPVYDTIPDANSVFYSRSMNSGATWTMPQLISRSGTRYASEVSLVASRTGGLHLIWAQNLTGGPVPQVIRHVGSFDGGVTWSAPRDLRVNPGFTSLRAVSDSCGRVHVVFQDWNDGPDRVHLGYAGFDRSWGAVALPFGKLIAVDPRLVRLDDGTVSLFFVGFTDPGPVLRLMRAGIEDLKPR